MENQKPRKINKFRGIPDIVPVETTQIVTERNHKDAKITRDSIKKANILDTPGPWARVWLDANDLQVVYTHGRAELRFKK